MRDRLYPFLDEPGTGEDEREAHAHHDKQAVAEKPLVLLVDLHALKRNARTAAPTRMRYAPNDVNECVSMKRMRNRTPAYAAMKETMKPTMMRSHSAVANAEPDLRRSYPVAASIVGMARRNENSTISLRPIPRSMPPTIVAPARDTPGTMASAWMHPMKKAVLYGISESGFPSLTLPVCQRSKRMRTMPPMSSIHAMSARFSMR